METEEPVAKALTEQKDITMAATAERAAAPVIHAITGILEMEEMEAMQVRRSPGR